MNTIAHILLSFLIGRHFTSDPTLLLVAVLLGNLPDLDHISHISNAARTGRFGPGSRSRFHELYGLSLISVLFVPVALLRHELLFLYYPLLSHYLADFLTRPTRPLYPVNSAEMHGSIYPRSFFWMSFADVLVTLVLFAGVLL